MKFCTLIKHQFIFIPTDRKISWQNDFHVTLYFFKITEHVEREI